MIWLLRIIATALLASFGFTSFAQTVPQPATLVADEVIVSRDRVLTARGNVQVFQGNITLAAQSVIYDRRSNVLQIKGPITLQDGGDVLILASQAELDPNLRTGLLRSARLVLDQQLQLAAVQINRVDARYSQLYKAAVTSCHVCDDGRPPLWQIRAKRIVHDQQEQQLYFDQVQLRVRSVPVLYIPRLRLPDPTLDRATGFLIPSIRTTSQLGNGVKIPYFIRLGDHRDLTLTPYLSPETRTLEYRYRQAFAAGRIEFEGAFTRDSLQSGQDRRYLFGFGRFDLGRDFKLDFDIELTSDDAYLKQYDFSDKDRLDSEIAVSRTRRDAYVRAGLIGFHSLRAGEINSTLPTIVADFAYERRFFPDHLGGELRLSFDAHSHYRSSSSTVSGEGRDVTRLHGGASWLRSWTLRSGFVAETRAGVGFDVFETAQDALFGGTKEQLVPTASVTLRYPMSKTGSDGVVQYLEPLLQLGWTGGTSANVADDESALVEFDEGNLLSLSRFPEADRREHGSTLALGLNWARYDPNGWESYLTLGQILREDTNPDFSRTSGLDGRNSDFLVAGQVRTSDGLALSGRFLFDDSFDFAKAEIRGDWSTSRTVLGGSYLWLDTDPAENRTKAVSELTLDGAYKLDNNWTVSGNWRYDVEDDRTARAGVGLGYENECVSFNLTAERRFTSSTSVEPETKFDFTIALRGFTAKTEKERYTRTCS